MATDRLGRTARTYSSYNKNGHSEVIKQEVENLRHLDEVVFEPLVNGIIKRTRQIQLDKKKLLKFIESRKKSLWQLIAKYFQSLEEKVVANCSKNTEVLNEKRQKITEEQSKMKLFCRNQKKLSINASSSFDMPYFLREVEKFKRRGRNIAHDQAVITIESTELAEVPDKGEELLQHVGSAIASVKIDELFDVGVVEKHYRVRINTPPLSQISKRNSGKHGKSSSRFPALTSETVTQPGQLQIIPIQSKEIPGYSSSQPEQLQINPIQSKKLPGYSSSQLEQLQINPIQSKKLPGYSSSQELSLQNERNKKNAQIQSPSSLVGDEYELPKVAQSPAVIPSTEPLPPQASASFSPVSTSVGLLRSSVDMLDAHPTKMESNCHPANYMPIPPSSLKSSCLHNDGRLRRRISLGTMSLRSVSPDECDRPVSGTETGEIHQSVGHPLPLLSSESAMEKAVPTHFTLSTRPCAQVSPFVGGMVKTLHHPYGVDTLTDGTRVVVETDTLHFLDKESDKVFKSIDLYAKDEAKATGCFDLTVLPNDDVIISNSQQRALLIVRNDSEESDAFMPLKDMVPKGVANDGKLIFVSDAKGRCVHKIDIATKSIIGRIDLEPTSGIRESTRSGELRRPCPKYLAINGQGDLVVSDAYNSTIYLIDKRDDQDRVSMFGSNIIPQLVHPTMPAGVSWLSDDMFVVAVQGTEQNQLLVIGVGSSPDANEPSCDVVNVFGTYVLSAEGEDEQVMDSPEGIATFGNRVLVSDFARLHSFPLEYVTDGASV